MSIPYLCTFLVVRSLLQHQINQASFSGGIYSAGKGHNYIQRLLLYILSF